MAKVGFCSEWVMGRLAPGNTRRTDVLVLLCICRSAQGLVTAPSFAAARSPPCAMQRLASWASPAVQMHRQRQILVQRRASSRLSCALTMMDAACLLSDATANLQQAPDVLLQLGQMYVNFLMEEAKNPQAALQHFGQWELDRFHSPEFCVLLPFYSLLCVAPRSPWSNIVRTSWATLSFYGAIFGLLGGQFGLYFYDVFEARCN